ncbi:hypothetical protein [Azospirillum sp. SYSU D00513]|uniref:hypothetical protein n=1 Tax=Azospirillum sp. SYSU D00513 TaxID=2812561 RepID=UPI00200035E5|nr:hypothetical protein [Azospirillum sp. SYSU D00513]
MDGSRGVATPSLSRTPVSRTSVSGAPRAEDGIPFDDAEEAWFWSVQAQDAKAEGARVVAGLGLVRRPCEPGDVLRAVDALHRRRLLARDHLHVLVQYGRLRMAPDAARRHEQRAHRLWREAFDRLVPVLRAKGIVR